MSEFEVSVDVFRLTDIEGDLSALFWQVQSEWGFGPWRRGELDLRPGDLDRWHEPALT